MDVWIVRGTGIISTGMNVNRCEYGCGCGCGCGCDMLDVNGVVCIQRQRPSMSLGLDAWGED